MDYTLKFPDQSTAEAFLLDFPDHSIDVIGDIYKPTGETTVVDGVATDVVAPVGGWHVNVRGVEDARLNQYLITVISPVRVWA